MEQGKQTNALNAKTNNYMIIGNNTTSEGHNTITYTYIYTVGPDTLKQVSDTTLLLGITFSNKLSWDKHMIDKVAKKMSKVYILCTK